MHWCEASYWCPSCDSHEGQKPYAGGGIEDMRALRNVCFWVGSIGQCNTARSLSAGVSKPKVFRGR